MATTMRRMVALSYLCVALMVIVSMIQHAYCFDNNLNIIEWKGLVLINESLTIPDDSVLSIQDDTHVVFYSSVLVDRPHITITINGTLEIGRNVRLMSLDMFDGQKQNSTYNNDYWSFVLDGKTNNIDMNSVSVIKSDELQRGVTFDIKQPLDHIKLNNCTMQGGYYMFRISAGEHVFNANESTFANMQSILVVALPENACKVSISNCYITKIGNGFIHKGSDSGKSSFTVYNTTFKNVGQGINCDKLSLSLTNVNFNGFKSAIVAKNVKALQVNFDNTGIKDSGIVAIANNRPGSSEGIFDIQQCTFKHIRGLAVAINSDMKLLYFTNNKVLQFSPSSILPYPMTLNLISSIFDLESVVFEHNEITECQLNGLYSIINFSNVKKLSFVKNSLIRNDGNCALSIKNVPPLHDIRIEQNIFDNFKSEICIQKTNANLNVSLNYWGKSVDKNLNLPTAKMNEIISSKLSPSKDFDFVPYYLTSNVNDNDASNLGGYIEPTKPSNHIGIIIGASSGAVALVFLVVIGLIILALIIYARKRRAYTEIYSI